MKKQNSTKKKNTQTMSVRGPQPFRPEIKTITQGLNLTALNLAPGATNPALYHVTSVCAVATGDTYSERSGNQILCRDLNLRLKVQVDPNSTATFSNLVSNSHVFRITVYKDMMPNGATVTWSTVFDTVPNNAGQEYDYQNQWSRKRFKILVDRFVRVEPSYVIWDSTNYRSLGNNKFVEFSIPLNCQTWFSDGTVSVTSIQQNNIGFFVSSDASSTAYPQLKFSYRSRVEFHDY